MKQKKKPRTGKLISIDALAQAVEQRRQEIFASIGITEAEFNTEIDKGPDNPRGMELMQKVWAEFDKFPKQTEASED